MLRGTQISLQYLLLMLTAISKSNYLSLFVINYNSLLLNFFSLAMALPLHSYPLPATSHAHEKFKLFLLYLPCMHTLWLPNLDVLTIYVILETTNIYSTCNWKNYCSRLLSLPNIHTLSHRYQFLWSQPS